MKAEELCANVPSALKQSAIELAENILFMEERLKDSREHMKDQPIVMAYDNGGGQKGIRKNPMFDAYNSLMRTYNNSLAQLIEILGEDASADLPKQGKLVKFANDKYGKVING